MCGGREERRERETRNCRVRSRGIRYDARSRGGAGHIPRRPQSPRLFTVLRSTLDSFAGAAHSLLFFLFVSLDRGDHLTDNDARAMSGSVRVRRQPSPPGKLSSHSTPRFPHPRHDHLDADERREAVSKGLRPGRKAHATGGLNLSSGEWKLLVVVLLIACAVRLFRISQPTSIV